MIIFWNRQDSFPPKWPRQLNSRPSTPSDINAPHFQNLYRQHWFNQALIWFTRWLVRWGWRMELAVPGLWDAIAEATLAFRCGLVSRWPNLPPGVTRAQGGAIVRPGNGGKRVSDRFRRWKVAGRGFFCFPLLIFRSSAIDPFVVFWNGSKFVGFVLISPLPSQTLTCCLRSKRFRLQWFCDSRPRENCARPIFSCGRQSKTLAKRNSLASQAAELQSWLIWFGGVYTKSLPSLRASWALSTLLWAGKSSPNSNFSRE